MHDLTSAGTAATVEVDGGMRWRSAVGAYATVTVGIGLTLTALLLRSNPQLDRAGSIAMLVMSMLWVSAIVNALFAAVVAAVCVVGRGRLPRAWSWAFWLSGLLALNVTWVLWHRLGMVHQWLSVRPFMTLAGMTQSALLLVIAFLLWRAGMGLSSRSQHRGRAVACVASASVLIVLTLSWNSHSERRHRRYELSAIRAAAGAPTPASAAKPEANRVIVVGVDGLDWATAVPLMKAGRMPSLARLVRAGAIGYLANGDESLSPRIWTTMFTGRGVEEHGIYGYIKMSLAGSHSEVHELLPLSPTADSFYGLSHLVQLMPTLGLWSMELTGTADRHAPTIWEIASHYERSVVVVNPLANLPVRPVRGVVATLSYDPESSPGAYHPAALAQRWGRAPLQDQEFLTDESFALHAARLGEEVSFTIEQIRENDAPLAIYYTHVLDTVAHMNWDFYARDRFFLTSLPGTLDDAQWERFVARYRDDRLFRAYVEIDRQLGRLAGAFPQYVIVLVSDHGWTYSGYEHFGSPDGVILLNGPGVRPVDLVRPDIVDVTPTVLSLLALPQARTLPGRRLVEAIGEADTPSVESYENVPLTTVARRPVDPGDEELERLRAIGYVD